MIKLGDVLASLKVTLATLDGPRESSTDDLFRGKRVVLFAVPGAFTPTCTAQHLPGFNNNVAKFRERGVSAIVCMAVNDAFVLGAWARSENISTDITLLADGSALFTRALGLELDLTQRGLGIRSQRFAMVVEDMRVIHLAVEQPGDFDVSKAESVLQWLRATCEVG